MLTCVCALLYASGLFDRVPVCARHHTGLDRRKALLQPGMKPPVLIQTTHDNLGLPQECLEMPQIASRH